MMHSHPMPITGIAVHEQAQKLAQLIQKYLRSPADQAHSFILTAKSVCPTHL